MRGGFYTKLAWTGIRKNKRLYYPYFIAGITMVMVFYVFGFLASSDVVHNLPGRQILPVIFELGEWGVGLFSILFLFYTNSSLIKKRKKELGLYNILGMNKRNLFYVLFWETVISYGIVVSIGIFAGILFAKIAELGLVNIMDRQVNYRVYVEWRSVMTALLVFAVIYFLILLNALRQIRNNNPIELLHSDSVGERPPKGHLFLTFISLAFIVAAYIVSESQQAVEEGSAKIFLTGILVLAGTFLFFLCASIYMCKLLQNNKRYYYKTSHFVTVSTMAYRMKRNGAGLASICILVTLVLVACSFSVSFYAGSMAVIRNFYPYDLGVRVEIPTENIREEISEGIYTKNCRLGMAEILQNADVQAKDSARTYSFHLANMLAMLVDGRLDLSRDMRSTWFTPGSGYFPGWEEGNEKIVWLHVISLEEYNQLCGVSEELEEDEVFVMSETVHYQKEDIVLYNGKTMKADKSAKKVPEIHDVKLKDERLAAHNCENLFLVVSDLYAFMGEEEGQAVYSQTNYMTYSWEYYLNLSASDEELYGIYDKVQKLLQEEEAGEALHTDCYLKIDRGENYYAFAGGLLFLAVIMDIVFIVVTALIMYYKQISEGYEDQKRFSIMRKIGMTTKEIKRSIRSQMLTVFSLPLLVAGMHLFFTSNIVYMLQKMAVADDKPLLLKVMFISFLLFGVFYSCIYALTSRVYFNIVNQGS